MLEASHYLAKDQKYEELGSVPGDLKKAATIKLSIMFCNCKSAYYDGGICIFHDMFAKRDGLYLPIVKLIDQAYKKKKSKTKDLVSLTSYSIKLLTFFYL